MLFSFLQFLTRSHMGSLCLSVLLSLVSFNGKLDRSDPFSSFFEIIEYPICDFCMFFQRRLAITAGT